MTRIPLPRFRKEGDAKTSPLLKKLRIDRPFKLAEFLKKHE